jgi:hypothetical protein
MNFCRCLQDDKYEWPSNEPLTFDGSAFKDDYPEESIRVFLSAALRSGKVRRMILRNLTLSTKSRSELRQVLQSNSYLESLTLYNISSFNKADDVGCPSSLSCTSEGLNCDFLTAGSQLQELSIERCVIDAQTSIVLRNGFHSFQNLKHLKLSNMKLTMDCAAIVDGVAQASALESLELNRVRIQSSVFTRLVHALRSSTSLKRLCLVECGLDKDQVQDLAQLVAHLCNLTELNLCGNDMDADCLDLLLRDGLSQRGSLIKLVLSSNPIGDEGAIRLSNYLSASHCKLESLSIVDCDVWMLGCRVLAERLEHFVSLKELMVDGEWEGHLEAISTSLKSNMVLTRFWMPQSPLLLHNGNPYMAQINYYLVLNRGRRRALVEKHLPLGMWPHILDWSTTRVTNKDTTDCLYHLLRQRPDLMESSTLSSRGQELF